MKKALFPGTFDPPTNGHLEIIDRASRLCDQLIVGIGTNTQKQMPLLKAQDRLKVLQEITSCYENVSVVNFLGLVTEYAEKEGIHLLIRGLRSGSELEWERQMALANRTLTGIETLFMITESKDISSSLIRELISFQAPLEDFIPVQVQRMIENQMKKGKI